MDFLFEDRREVEKRESVCVILKAKATIEVRHCVFWMFINMVTLTN